MWINSTISKVERCFKNDARPSSCPITDYCRCAAGWRTGRWLVWQNDWPDGRAFGHDCRRCALFPLIRVDALASDIGRRLLRNGVDLDTRCNAVRCAEI